MEENRTMCKLLLVYFNSISSPNSLGFCLKSTDGLGISNVPIFSLFFLRINWLICTHNLFQLA
jgi:hypothetical protein